MKSGTRAFGLIFATLLINIAAMGMTLPVLPGIISGHGQQPFQPKENSDV